MVKFVILLSYVVESMDKSIDSICCILFDRDQVLVLISSTSLTNTFLIKCSCVVSGRLFGASRFVHSVELLLVYLKEGALSWLAGYF